MIEANQQSKFDLQANAVPLTDYIGKEISFVFVAEARIANASVPTGTTIKVRVEAGDDGIPNLFTTSPWLLNTATVLAEGYQIPRPLYLTSHIYLSPPNR